MKKSLIIGSILVFTLLACTSTANISTATVGIPNSTADGQPGMDKTQEYFSMQTIVALEQLTNTPTPTKLSNTPTPWVVVSTKTQPQLAFATAVGPRTSVYQGPGTNYRVACYVDGGIQLIITGRNIDFSWLGVTFSQGQTCYSYSENYTRTDINPDPIKQFWISYSSFTISGNLSNVPIITSNFTIPPPSVHPTPTPYGAAFWWSDIPSSSLSIAMNSISNSFNIKHGLYFIILTTSMFILSIYKLITELVISSKRRKSITIQ